MVHAVILVTLQQFTMALMSQRQTSGNQQSNVFAIAYIGCKDNIFCQDYRLCILALIIQAFKQQQMSKETKDQEVLMAILNVKKYAKNLKKKVSNLHDPNEEGNFNDVISSPSFFQTRPQQYMELGSPLLATKSSYNQSFQSLTRQKKQHSMTFLPGPKRGDRQSRKNSDVLLPQPISPAKTYTHTNAKTLLSQSYKVEGTGLKSANESGWKKQRKQSSQTFINLQKKASKKKEEQNSQIPIKAQPHSTPQPYHQQQQQQQQDNKLMLQLLLQINNLKNQICDYKKALIVLRTKFLEMEQKCNNKIQNDHLLDVYRIKIETLENEKQVLNQVIKKQNQKIVSFQVLVVEISKKIVDKFQAQIDRVVKLEAQNSVYRHLLNLQTPKFEAGGCKIQELEGTVRKKQKKEQNELNHQSETESQGQGYSKPLTIGEGKICKTEKTFTDKYDKFRVI